MDENRVEGTASKVMGRVEDAVGGLTGDTATQLRGKARQVAGDAQKLYGNSIDTVQDFVRENPLMAAGLIGGAAFLLGVICGRR